MTRHSAGGLAGERDRWVADLAERQRGTAAWWQIRDAGIPRQFVDTRLGRGRLHIVYRGVYGVGHSVLSREGWWMAAVLALAPGAVLSHVSAAVHWGLLPYWNGRAIHVTPATRGRRSRRRDNILVHRPEAPVERTEHDGIPVTSVADTLLDLAATVQRPTLEKAVESSMALRLFDLEAVKAASVSGRNGCRALAAAIAGYDEAPTRSEFERRFLKLCTDHGLPRPQVNVLVGEFEVDFLWPLHRVVVEADGLSFHATPQAAERDRRRDAALALAGYRTQRFTWRQLMSEPETVVAVLTMLLGR